MTKDDTRSLMVRWSHDSPPVKHFVKHAVGNGEGSLLYTRGKFSEKGYRFVTGQREVAERSQPKVGAINEESVMEEKNHCRL